MKYKPSKFMLPTSHYDKNKADYAVTFIECLKNTKGRWAGKDFILIVGLYKEAYEGEISFNDINMKELDTFYLRKNFIAFTEKVLSY